MCIVVTMSFFRVRDFLSCGFELYLCFPLILSIIAMCGAVGLGFFRGEPLSQRSHLRVVASDALLSHAHSELLRVRRLQTP